MNPISRERVALAVMNSKPHRRCGMRLLFVALFPWALLASVLLPESTSAATETVKLQPAVRSAQVGQRIGTSGDAAIIGSNGAGAYIYRYDGTQWVEEALLTPSDGSGGNLGFAVDISGDVAVVTRRNHCANCPGAYIFRYDGSQWNEEAALVSPTAQDDFFGWKASITDDVIVVTAVNDDEAASNAGAAYVFRFDGTSWNPEAKLLASDADAGDVFGLSVTSATNRIVVGSHPGERVGAVYVYDFDGTNWNETTKLVAPNPQEYDDFGSATALDGNTLAVGAPAIGSCTQGASCRPGAVHVFTRNGASWTHALKLVPASVAADVAFGFGYDVDVAGNVLIAGSSGGFVGSQGGTEAHVYRFDGAQWFQEARLTASDPGSDNSQGRSFGFAVHLTADSALVGRPEGTDGGAVYAYASRCNDSLDNDGDGFVDLVDPGCNDMGDLSEQTDLLVCDDGLDNDGDGLADGADPGCSNLNDPSERDPSLTCDNGLDDDGDGLVDQDDPGCISPADVSEREAGLLCDNGLDDDGDGLADFPADPGCATPSSPTENPACDDLADNDGDGLVDYPQDDGCFAAFDPTEVVGLDLVPGSGCDVTWIGAGQGVPPGAILQGGTPAQGDPWFAFESNVVGLALSSTAPLSGVGTFPGDNLTVLLGGFPQGVFLLSGGGPARFFLWFSSISHGDSLACSGGSGPVTFLSGVPPDFDADEWIDDADNCSASPNGPRHWPSLQTDTDADDFGNACDCDFDNDGACSIADFNLFLPDFMSSTDSGMGTDMDQDGAVGIGDFNLFLPGFQTGAPGPSGLVP
jgi:hypothetical protein